MFEQTAGLFLPLHAGASVHYATSRQSPVILKTLRRHRVTAMVVVPQVLELLLDGMEREIDRRGTLERWEAAQRLAPQLPLRARRLLFRASTVSSAASSACSQRRGGALSRARSGMGAPGRDGSRGLRRDGVRPQHRLEHARRAPPRQRRPAGAGRRGPHRAKKERSSCAART